MLPYFGIKILGYENIERCGLKNTFPGTVCPVLQIPEIANNSEYQEWFQIERGENFFNCYHNFKATGSVDQVGFQIYGSSTYRSSIYGRLTEL